MDCTDINAILSGLVDDEIAPERRHEAERHLAGCGSCRALVGRAESLDAELRGEMERWQRGIGFGEPSIRAVVDRTVGGDRVLRRARQLAGLGWIAAAAAIALAVSAWTLGPATSGRGAAGISGTTSASSPRGTSSVRPSAAGAQGGEGQASETPDRIAPMRPPGLEPPDAACAAAPALPHRAPGSDEAIAALVGPPGCMALIDENGSAMCDGRPRGPAPERRFEPLPADLASEASHVLFASAVLFSRIADEGPLGFDAEADPVATILEYDALADRLARIRRHLPRGVDRAAVWATEAMLLRLRERPLDDAERQEMREDIIRMRLIEMLDAASRRIERLPPA
ncbi:MAG TPA: zf-HC2 domain-containing protein [Phycisphaerales bacterium]|nr:zf-HC2 domain-containing protein [Phycisphaerales bacterium]HMP37298.1 zf-HC2 domain-containing protein [Phycisphaerales bacterium]